MSLRHKVQLTARGSRAAAVIILTGLVLIPSLHTAAGTEPPPTMETVRGQGCYRFGDEETPAKARRTAMAMAQEQAIRGHRVFVESTTRVKNFQLEEDLIQTASAAMLHDIRVESEDRKAQEICVTISAKMSPVSIEDLIRQRVAAKEIAQTAESTLVPEQPAFGLKVWTNKQEGAFLEDERLIIYVRSERDTYLKLDYFQADGTVVHLVPNLYRGQAYIKGRQTYAFGDDTGPEQFVIKSPYGEETIKAIASIRPFDIATEPTEAVSESRAYLKGLRGIKVVAAAASVELKTESRSVAEHKASLRKNQAP
jgi:hypothetical protein